MTQFPYDAIPLGESEIRLVRLLPSDDPEESISAEIVRASIANGLSSLPFVALSWEWGNAEHRCDMLAFIPGEDGSRGDRQGVLSITRNLADALRRLRRRCGEALSLPLWIDQVCINQADDEEKSRQIPLMTDIYSLSETTIGWLGERDDDAVPGGCSSSEVMATLRGIGCEAIDIGLPKVSPKQYNLMHSDAGDDEAGLTAQLDAETASIRASLLGKIADSTPPWDLPCFSGIIELCARRYFTRGWIQQEIAIPKTLVFQWGESTIDGDVFGAAILFLKLHFHHAVGRIRRTASFEERTRIEGSVFRDFAPVDQNVSLCLGARRQYHLDNTVRFFNLAFILRKYKHLSFTVPRDHIYGTLGLANDAEDVRRNVNVKRPWNEVFVEAARSVLLKPVNEDDWLGGINGLSMACYKGPARFQNSKLPSWVPDYRHLPSQMTLAEQTIHFLDRPFNASRDFKDPETLAQINHGSCLGSQTINVRGVIVDRILKVGSVSPHAVGASMLKQAIELDDYCRESVRIISSDPTASTHPFRHDVGRLSEAAWRVPILDSEFVSNPTACRRATSLTRACHRSFLSSRLVEGSSHVQIQNFMEQISPLASRRPLLGEKGFVGVGPYGMEEGDVLVVLSGGMFPFLLREIEEGKFRLVGEVFCDGIMDGEAVGIGPIEQFCLV